MLTRLQLKKIFFGWFAAFWSVAAWAAQTTFAGDITSIPPAAIAVSVLLAIIGGAAYTAQKIADVDTVIKSVPAEIIKDLLNSIVVGILIFFVGSYYQWASVVTAGLITLGGYGGSRVLEPALASFLKWIGRLGAKAQ